MSTKIFRAVILGAPASGKGTISSRIVEKFGFVHISPGDILRLNIANGTALGKKAKLYMDEGKLVPDDLIIKCVSGRIIETGNRSWMLDGFPRTVAQAERLQSIQPVDAVLNLNVPTDEIVERVKGRWIHLSSGRVYNVGFNNPKVPFKDDLTGEDLVQRADDQPDVVRKRLEVYHEAMKPVLEFYEKYNIVSTFSGRKTAEIWPEVQKFLLEKTEAVIAKRQ